MRATLSCRRRGAGSAAVPAERVNQRPDDFPSRSALQTRGREIPDCFENDERLAAESDGLRPGQNDGFDHSKMADQNEMLQKTQNARFSKVQGHVRASVRQIPALHILLHKRWIKILRV